VSEAIQTSYPRFRVGARIEHFILLSSFIILGATGLPQKYAETGVGEWMINAMGGIETIRLIHHYAAFFLAAGAIYHLFTGAYRFFVKHERMRMVPDLKDATDMLDTIKYNLFIKDEPAKMRKFNPGEKFEYWVAVWGTAIMGITGFILLNPVATSSVLPGEVIPAALAAHSWEALLAVLSIFIWHFYDVLIKHLNPSMLTGKLPRHQMEEDHFLELERLDAGGEPWPNVGKPVLQRRRRIFLIVSVVVGALLLYVAIWMFTFEETALTTVPRVTQEIFVPLATQVP
jgi:cytochrome b subunit of formate dehydrogenase